MIIISFPWQLIIIRYDNTKFMEELIKVGKYL